MIYKVKSTLRSLRIMALLEACDAKMAAMSMARSAQLTYIHVKAFSGPSPLD